MSKKTNSSLKSLLALSVLLAGASLANQSVLAKNGSDDVNSGSQIEDSGTGVDRRGGATKAEDNETEVDRRNGANKPEDSGIEVDRRNGATQAEDNGRDQRRGATKAENDSASQSGPSANSGKSANEQPSSNQGNSELTSNKGDGESHVNANLVDKSGPASDDTQGSITEALKQENNTHASSVLTKVLNWLASIF